MSPNSPPSGAPRPALSQTEFIGLIAMMFATIAFSIDAMLPALPEIARTLSPDAPNNAQLIITSFVLGMGIGTLFAGPLSDAFGRRAMILAGSALYCAAAATAIFAPSLETILAARVVMGIGAAGPRIVSIAIVRDLYSGRQMARIMSFAMMIFTLVPAVAPLIGSGIIAVADWRAIFLAFVAFSAVTMLWFGLRQPETLAPPARLPLRFATLAASAREVSVHPVVRGSILVQTLLFGALFAALSSIQPLFDVAYGRGESFPYWFALVSLIGGTASFLNASLVVRVGMRRMVRHTLEAQIVLGLAMIAATLALPEGGTLAFAAFLVWIVGLFAMAGLTLGNVNAIAMEPMGHIAGMAASIVAAVATVGAVVFAVPVGLAFDGSVLPLACGTLAMVVAARWLLVRIPA